LFFQEATGLKLSHRVIDQVDLDLRLLDTGDVLVARRFTGRDTLMMVLSGSLASHIAVVV
jgi:hypothetical protein